MKRVALTTCLAALLVGCSMVPDVDLDFSQSPDPVDDGFTSLRDFATTVNESNWGCNVESAPDEDATRASLDSEGLATMTCGTDNRITIWVSEAKREEMSRKAPFAVGPPYCEVRSANWSAKGSVESTRALRGQLGIDKENCAIA